MCIVTCCIEMGASSYVTECIVISDWKMKMGPERAATFALLYQEVVVFTRGHGP